MNNLEAIQKRFPSEREILCAINQATGDGEWISASEFWKITLGDECLKKSDLQALSAVSLKIHRLVQAGDLAKSWLAEVPQCRVELIRINGQIVNPANVDELKMFFGLSQLTYDLGHGYMLTGQGRERVTKKSRFDGRTLVTASLLMAATACSSYRNLDAQLPARQVLEAEHQLVQMRNVAGEVVWAYCDANCPQPTPKTLPQPIRVVEMRKPQEVKTVVEEKSEKVGIIAFFKYKSVTMPQSERVKLAEILAGNYEWQGVKIVGRADPVGADAANRRLALLRAQEMKSALIAVGLPEGRIALDGMVEKKAADQTNIALGSVPKNMDQQSRRVDVEILRKKVMH